MLCKLRCCTEQRWFAQSNPTLPQPSMAAVSTASQPLRLVRTLTHTDEPVSAIAISSDRRTLIRAYPSGKIEQWDVQTGERIREMRAIPMSFSPLPLVLMAEA
uniref:Uncharacterized protein n=1 Tax=Desertifilum tharense IPPAS B-1220 TaxID=1781255 RepID=A0ACD5GRT7_9CYAN